MRTPQPSPTPNWKEIILAGPDWPEDLIIPQNDKLPEDSECIQESMCTTMHLDFADYIRFKPTGSGSIFVTLGMMNWHIYATAGFSGTNYVLTPTPEGAADPNLTDSANFPRDKSCQRKSLNIL